jgi:glycosyltransferase involved in cell wall biosynthesis
VTHPGRQHSHQAALGLQRQGMLAGYWSGVPATATAVAWLPRRLWSRYEAVQLPDDLVRTTAWVPAMRRLGDRFLPQRVARRVDFVACRWFDEWAARQLQHLTIDAVIACEISALSTFRVARRRHVATLLDAPSIHHQAQDRLHGTADSPQLHRRIAQVKNAEIALADHVLTVSDLAQSTYVEAGVAIERAHALPLGADLQMFSPRAETPHTRRDHVVFTFIGATIQRKGFDLLLSAFRHVSERHPRVELRVVGPVIEEAPWLATIGSRVTVLGPMRQKDLAVELRRSDCLVLPSRNDSYAMVVAEALACGTPVIVSEMVGAKFLVTESVNGWIVPLEDAGALAERMAACASEPMRLRAMRPACSASARAATWPAYHQRLTALAQRLISQPPEAATSTG